MIQWLQWWYTNMDSNEEFLNKSYNMQIYYFIYVSI